MIRSQVCAFGRHPKVVDFRGREARAERDNDAFIQFDRSAEFNQRAVTICFVDIGENHIRERKAKAVYLENALSYFLLFYERAGFACAPTILFRAHAVTCFTVETTMIARNEKRPDVSVHAAVDGKPRIEQLRVTSACRPQRVADDFVPANRLGQFCRRNKTSELT